jgi:hypothetical protein
VNPANDWFRGIDELGIGSRREEGGGFPARGERRGKLVELRFRNDREIVGAGHGFAHLADRDDGGVFVREEAP